MDKLGRTAILLSLVFSWCVSLTFVRAEDFPTRPVRIISGFGPGSAGDLLARIVSERLAQTLKQRFIIEYRPGAGSSVAAEYVTRASADGYTLFLATSANTINATLSSNLSFDFSKDLAPITLMASAPQVLAVNTSIGVGSARELIALAKSKPEQIQYATPGFGTLSHLSGELLNFLAGIKLVHVPYQGSAQGLSDVIAGRVSAIIAPVNIIWPYVEAGMLKALAVTDTRRSSLAPEIPTMAEATDLTQYGSAIWYGLLAPSGTPSDIIDKLSREINQALQDKEIRSLILKLGMEPSGGGPAVFARHIETDTKKWAEVISAMGIKRY